jgi:hypothetical protein
MNSNTSYKQKNTGQYIFIPTGEKVNYAQTLRAETLCVPSVFFLVLCSMSLVPSFFFSSFFFLASLLVACCVLPSSLFHVPCTFFVSFFSAENLLFSVNSRYAGD